jgi:hypothetical protein
LLASIQFSEDSLPPAKAIVLRTFAVQRHQDCLLCGADGVCPSMDVANRNNVKKTGFMTIVASSSFDLQQVSTLRTGSQRESDSGSPCDISRFAAIAFAVSEQTDSRRHSNARNNQVES